jgi:aryl-alcohol dehydrogenase-like predicted oxidoreductase/predicted kinase
VATIGIGTLREPAVEVIAAAIEAGVGVIDTADVYGDAERMLAGVEGARIVTKGGLVPGWRPDGRAKHLEEAARRSRERLGRAPDLFLLHAVDPQVPIETSVRALVRLKEEGVVKAIGVGNVGRTQLEAALAVGEISAVEIELSPWKIDAVRGGVLALCRERGIEVLAYRPLGGVERAARLAKDAELRKIGERIGATPQEIVIAWVATMGVPLVGATRVETAAGAGRAGRLELGEWKEVLDARWLGIVNAKAGERRDGEVVIVMGMPAAGKTTTVQALVTEGYARLNRDEIGGTLDRVARKLDEVLGGGEGRVVLDNTYATRSSRAPVIAAARRHGLRVRCVWLDTPIEEAQRNAVERMLDRCGALLEPDEMKRRAKKEPNLIPPNAQFRWRRALEPPAIDEGFDAVEVVTFARRTASGGARGVIVELGGEDWARLAPAIERARAAGWVVVGTAWRPAEAAAAPAAAAGVDVAVCPHPAGPPVCWCRKPLPGLGLVLARKHELDLGRSVHVGRGPADRGFAARLGVRFVEIEEWLAGGA